MARQPIFDAQRHVVGYELLYRDAGNIKEAQFVDGDRATCRLLSDAITVFGLRNLTNGKWAYVNFTDTLILNDFVLLAKPREIVVELLEDIKVTERLIEKVKSLKRKGYRFALDDYTGDPRFSELLPLVNVVKVDFLLTDARQQEEIAGSLRKYKRLTMLAEKVETQAEFDWAISLGFKSFQGYFFEKPRTFQKKSGSVVKSSSMRLLMELNRSGGADFKTCAGIIHADASMTYRIIQRVHRLAYYRGNPITAIERALVMLGLDEVRRWALLVLARDNNVINSEELARKAYLRGVFAKRLMSMGPEKRDAEYGFLLGMFSLLDQILGMDMEELMQDVELPPEVTRALLKNEENYYSRLMRFVEAYESHSDLAELPDIGVTCGELEITRAYMNSVIDTDKVFGMTEGSL